MTTTPLFHAGMMANLRDFFPALAAIQGNTPTYDGAGQPVDVWATITGLDAIPCKVAPWSSAGTPPIQESRLAQMTIDRDVYVISLRGYWPEIHTGDRAVVDAVNYDIIAAQHDSQSVYTRLVAEIVSV